MNENVNENVIENRKLEIGNVYIFIYFECICFLFIQQVHLEVAMK